MELISDLMGESDFTVIAWRQAKKPTTSRRPAAFVHLPLVYCHPLTKKIPSTIETTLYYKIALLSL